MKWLHWQGWCCSLAAWSLAGAPFRDRPTPSAAEFVPRIRPKTRPVAREGRRVSQHPRSFDGGVVKQKRTRIVGVFYRCANYPPRSRSWLVLGGGLLALRGSRGADDVRHCALGSLARFAPRDHGRTGTTRRRKRVACSWGVCGTTRRAGRGSDGTGRMGTVLLGTPPWPTRIRAFSHVPLEKAFSLWLSTVWSTNRRKRFDERERKIHG
jgi:hypothetical protein